MYFFYFSRINVWILIKCSIVPGITIHILYLRVFLKNKTILYDEFIYFSYSWTPCLKDLYTSDFLGHPVFEGFIYFRYSGTPCIKDLYTLDILGHPVRLFYILQIFWDTLYEWFIYFRYSGTPCMMDLCKICLHHHEI